MAYFEYYCNNITTKDVNSEKIIGNCYQMCPEEEINIRVKENLVHLLEKSSSGNKLVKCYSRSAADSNVAKPNLLRPFKVLKETVEYLLLEITKRPNVSKVVVYEFINDRLRAVRQDMTIQRLPQNECLILLEPMIRFHVYFGYKLCDLEIRDYDPVLNKMTVLECLKLYLSCSDAIEKNENIDNLSNLMSNVKVKETVSLTNDRVLMESLYIMCNLDNIHPLYRYIKLNSCLKKKPILKISYDIAIEVLRGNYVKVGRLSRKLCPLTFCAFCIHLPVLQKGWLGVVCAAYSAARLRVPATSLRDWLLYDSAPRAAAAAQHYGLHVCDGMVHCAKPNFKHDADLYRYKYLTRDKTDESLETMFTYRTN